MANMRHAFAALTLAVLALSSSAPAQQPPDAHIQDTDTLEWWHTTEFLSSDAMEGRNAGTAAYQRAADYVAQRFRAAGLRPAGDNGTFFQTVPMHQVDVVPDGTSFTIKRDNGGELSLRFLHEITIAASATAPREAEAPLTFRGYCGKDALADARGKIVLCFGTQRAGLPSGAERVANVRAAGALGIINVDDPYFSIEPPRWPWAYARSVILREPTPTRDNTSGTMLPPMRLSAEAFARLLEGTGQDPAAILKAGGAKQPIASFEIGAKLRVKLQIASKDISSPNVLAVLRGTDPALKDQYLVVAAHLDGYGYGTPVDGDNLYNGALDDAAYVALLIQMADDLHLGRGRAAAETSGIDTRQYNGTTLAAPKRSILFCAFTGEEKGLLGSTWFVEHPTVPKPQLVADINLDQLRPLFPLRILTVPGIDLTSLGDTARKVAAPMGIELREDREPERQLLRRADNWPFLKAGIPAIGFVFGFGAGTDAERRYREWYQVRYHRPQDGVTQPMDFQAATAFNTFFYRLVETVADQPKRPEVLKK